MIEQYKLFLKRKYISNTNRIQWNNLINFIKLIFQYTNFFIVIVMHKGSIKTACKL